MELSLPRSLQVRKHRLQANDLTVLLLSKLESFPVLLLLLLYALSPLY